MNKVPFVKPNNEIPFFFQVEERNPDNAAPQIDYDLIYWLEQVRYHSLNGASEGASSLLNLANNTPNFENVPQEWLEVLEKINGVVQTKKYDPTLSPQSKRVLNQYINRLFPQQAEPEVEPMDIALPPVNRRLDFGNVQGNGFGY